MALTESGVDLAVAALAQIELHPETWSQQSWRCETGMCLAGWMAELSSEVGWTEEDAHSRDANVTLPDGTDLPVYIWADQVLPGGFEGQLFVGTNTIEDLRAGVKAAANGEDIGRAVRGSWQKRGAPFGILDA